MTPRDVRAYLFDIVEAARRIEAFAEGKTLDDYLADALLSSAIERQFEIVGEALRRAVDAEPGLGEVIPHARRVIGFRNILIHGYAELNGETVWDTVRADVVPLRERVEALLRERS